MHPVSYVRHSACLLSGRVCLEKTKVLQFKKFVVVHCGVFLTLGLWKDYDTRSRALLRAIHESSIHSKKHAYPPHRYKQVDRHKNYTMNGYETLN